MEELHLNNVPTLTISEIVNMLSESYVSYIIELLRNIEFVITDYLEDNLTDYQNIKLKNKKIYIRKEYLEETSIVRISLNLVKALERHFETLGLIKNKKMATSNKVKFTGDNDVEINDTDGNKDEEKKFWENKIKNATKK